MISVLSVTVRPSTALILCRHRHLITSVGSVLHSRYILNLRNSARFRALAYAKQSNSSGGNRLLAVRTKKILLVVTCISVAIVMKFVPRARVIVSCLLAAPSLISKLKDFCEETKWIAEFIQFFIAVFDLVEKKMKNRMKQKTNENEKMKNDAQE
ncbi:hypothetical protein WN944_024753 [Citrus x changshan-huyou]|uniref:Uncharacterized protein n=1 Tax=Citrus x changshan-huyou TaxID=2935761 RepID=A0AAP0LT34_9ROSI